MSILFVVLNILLKFVYKIYFLFLFILFLVGKENIEIIGCIIEILEVFFCGIML